MPPRIVRRAPSPSSAARHPRPPPTSPSAAARNPRPIRRSTAPSPSVARAPSIRRRRCSAPSIRRRAAPPPPSSRPHHRQRRPAQRARAGEATGVHRRLYQQHPRGTTPPPFSFLPSSRTSLVPLGLPLVNPSPPPDLDDDRRRGAAEFAGGLAMLTAVKVFLNSPVGPKTTHSWGPVANWGFVLARREGYQDMCNDDCQCLYNI